MIQHPQEQLSAYLDGALAAAERASVEAHLASCGRCRARLAELREVSRLLAALPELAPRRSLLPRRLPAWLVPARLVSGLATAAFALLFVVNGVSALGPLGAAPAAPAPAALERAREAPAAPAAPALAAPTPVPVPAAAATATADQAASPKTAEQRTAAGAQQSPTPTAALFGVTESRATPVPRGAVPAQELGFADRAGERITIPPWAWLVAALAAGAMTIGLHRAITRRRS